MKLEAIEQTRSPLGKLRLRFENGKSLLVYPSIVVDLGLYTGMEISDAALESLTEQNGVASARERATRILSYGVISGSELEHRLRQKGESEEHAREAVQWLQELRLLDDRQAAEQIVRSGLSKGYGPARIRQMLYEKRIPRELWQEAMEDLPESDEAIDRFLQKRFRGKNPDGTECKRATDALLRRGHSWSDIRRALERYAPEEEFEE